MLKRKVFTLIILSIIFGLIGSVSGVIFMQSYAIKKAFDIPIYGDYNMNSQDSGSRVVIEEVKNVVIEQNDRVFNISAQVKNSIVGVFDKKNKVVDENFDIVKDSYFINDNIAQGFILTSDGWIVTDIKNEDLIEKLDVDKIATTTKINILNSYIVMTFDESIYDLDDIYYNKQLKKVFVHISANDLPARVLSNSKNIKEGELAIFSNWQEGTILSSVKNIVSDSSLVKSSDIFQNHITYNLNEFNSSFAFNLSGDFVAMVDDFGETILSDEFKNEITRLSSDKVKEKAKLGIDYINLDFLISEENLEKKGALIYKDKIHSGIAKGLLAEEVGLRVGDIILSIDNFVVTGDDDLNSIIDKFSVGDKVKIVYTRTGEKYSVDVKF